AGAAARYARARPQPAMTMSRRDVENSARAGRAIERVMRTPRNISSPTLTGTEKPSEMRGQGVETDGRTAERPGRACQSSEARNRVVLGGNRWGVRRPRTSASTLRSGESWSARRTAANLQRAAGPGLAPCGAGVGVATQDDPARG